MWYCLFLCILGQFPTLFERCQNLGSKFSGCYVTVQMTFLCNCRSRDVKNKNCMRAGMNMHDMASFTFLVHLIYNVCWWPRRRSSLRGRRLKGKGKGVSRKRVLGARETRRGRMVSRPSSLPLPFRTPVTRAKEGAWRRCWWWWQCCCSVHCLYPFIDNFWLKRYPFHIPCIEKWYPFNISINKDKSLNWGGVLIIYLL